MSQSVKASPLVVPFIYPLDDFYLQESRALPRVHAIRGEQMPEPYKSLLVHFNDMTPTLETYHKESIYIEVLRHQQRGQFYFREVILRLENSDQPVEFGAIKIDLSLFKSAARQLILEGHVPLGHIMEIQHINHQCRPKAFFELDADAFIGGALQTTVGQVLYGRRNSLLDENNVSLAEVVEILPPQAA